LVASEPGGCGLLETSEHPITNRTVTSRGLNNFAGRIERSARLTMPLRSIEILKLDRAILGQQRTDTVGQCSTYAFYVKPDTFCSSRCHKERRNLWAAESDLVK